MEQHLHAGGPDELVEHQLEVFRVERDVAVRNFRAFQTGELPGGAPHDFRADSAVEQPLAVGKGAPGADQPGSAHAAEAAGVFDQQRVGSAARGGDGGGDSGRAAAGDDQIIGLFHRMFPDKCCTLWYSRISGGILICPGKERSPESWWSMMSSTAFACLGSGASTELMNGASSGTVSKP